MSSTIPKDIALELCEEIRTNNQQKRVGIGKTQCYFCWKFAKEKYNAGNPSKLCIFATEDLRGCEQVNKLYDARYSS